MEINLQELLQSRDERQATQQALLQQYSGATLCCLTIVMPGSEKRNDMTEVIARAAVEAILNKMGLHIVNFFTQDKPTGFEAYAVLDCPADRAKALACEIEETHPLGRLMDIDILSSDGIHLSRQTPRRCLLCDNEARVCMRAHTHTPEQLMAKITQLIDDYRQHESMA